MPCCPTSGPRPSGRRWRPWSPMTPCCARTAPRHLGARIGPVGIGARMAWRGGPSHDPRAPAVPFKANAARRHRIPRQRHRVTNWAEYEAALRQRGSLTVWFTDAAVAAWRAEPRTTRGGQPWYSPLAILTALTLRAVFRLALRQTEGLIGSILRLLGLDLAVPDHITLSRRAGTLEAPPPGPAGRGRWRCRAPGGPRAAGRCTCWWTARA